MPYDASWGSAAATTLIIAESPYQRNTFFSQSSFHDKNRPQVFSTSAQQCIQRASTCIPRVYHRHSYGTTPSVETTRLDVDVNLHSQNRPVQSAPTQTDTRRPLPARLPPRRRTQRRKKRSVAPGPRRPPLDLLACNVRGRVLHAQRIPSGTRDRLQGRPQTNVWSRACPRRQQRLRERRHWPPRPRGRVGHGPRDRRPPRTFTFTFTLPQSVIVVIIALIGNARHVDGRDRPDAPDLQNPHRATPARSARQQQQQQQRHARPRLRIVGRSGAGLHDDRYVPEAARAHDPTRRWTNVPHRGDRQGRRYDTPRHARCPSPTIPISSSASRDAPRVHRDGCTGRTRGVAVGAGLRRAALVQRDQHRWGHVDQRHRRVIRERRRCGCGCGLR